MDPDFRRDGRGKVKTNPSHTTPRKTHAQEKPLYKNIWLSDECL